MTVSEAIEILQRMPPDAALWIQSAFDDFDYMSAQSIHVSSELFITNEVGESISSDYCDDALDETTPGAFRPVIINYE